jgi:hypothetical protein
MKNVIIYLILTILTTNCLAQVKKNIKPKPKFKTSFPKDWYGHWKGKMQWTTPTKDTLVIFTMHLIIKPTDTPNVITWQIQYGDSLQDVRPYTCKIVDAAKKHWVVDEHNGILIDQYNIGNAVFSSFAVENSLITDNMQLQPDRSMRVEFVTTSTEPVRNSGSGTDESPTVKAYAVKSFQVGTLYKLRSMN